MTAYAAVDEVINAWAEANAKKLFTEWAGEPARFAYLSGLRPFECFQITIAQPESDRVTVSARSVDTDDGIEFERHWEGPVEDTSALLAEATEAVRGWINRPPANVR